MRCRIRWWLAAVSFAISLTAARAVHTATDYEDVQYISAVRAVGYNRHGALGDNDWHAGSSTKTSYLVTVLIEHSVERIACGWFHCLFVTAEGYVYASGWATNGQLGDGSVTGTCGYCEDKHIPEAVLTDVSVVDVAAGHVHSLFLTAEGMVYSCGRGAALGNGDTSGRNYYTPAPVLITHPIAQISAGNYHSLFLTTSGAAYACGTNWAGHLGDGSTTERLIPVPVMTDGFMTEDNVVQVAAGGHHSLFLTKLGTLHGCGYNDRGQLATGYTSIQNTIPVYITNLITQVSAGNAHTLALATNGVAYASGNNSYGQLCNGGNTASHVFLPLIAEGIADVVQVSAGENHNLFLTAEGIAYSCGINELGALGDGTFTDRNTMVPVLIERPVKQVAAGYSTSFFIYETSSPSPPPPSPPPPLPPPPLRSPPPSPPPPSPPPPSPPPPSPPSPPPPSPPSPPPPSPPSPAPPPASSENFSEHTETSPGSSGSSLSPGYIYGAAGGLPLLGVFGFFLYRRRRKKKQRVDIEQPVPQKVSIAASSSDSEKGLKDAVLEFGVSVGNQAENNDEEVSAFLDVQEVLDNDLPKFKFLDFASSAVPAAELAKLVFSSAATSFSVLKAVAGVAGEIHKLQQQVKANHRMCHRLAKRALSLQSTLARFAQQLQHADPSNLDVNDYENLNIQLCRVLEAMELAHDLILAWGSNKDTFFRKLKRALLSRHFHDEFTYCSQTLSECLADLQNQAILQMFVHQVAFPSVHSWSSENSHDSQEDIQQLPTQIANIAENQGSLEASLYRVNLSVMEMKEALEAHGVTEASLQKGFAMLEMKLDRIDHRLESLGDMQREMLKEVGKLTKVLNSQDSTKANNRRGEADSKSRKSKAELFKESMPHLAISFSEIRMQETIGEGGFGIVFRASWQGNQAAYKKITVDNSNKKAAIRQVEALYKEAYVMSLLRNPNLCGIYGVVLEAPHYGLLMPYYSGGALDDFLRDKTVQVTRDMYVAMALNVASAMVYMHTRAQPVVHGDLKSRNVLLASQWEEGSSPQLILCDFGLSAVKLDVQSTAHGSMTSTVTQQHGGGTLNWQAPEQLEGRKPNQKTDVYSFGMLMYELVSREYPFERAPEAMVVMKLRAGERPSVPQGVLEPFAQLIIDCWAQEPENRPDFIQVNRRLQNMADVYCHAPHKLEEAANAALRNCKGRKDLDWYDSAYRCPPEI